MTKPAGTQTANSKSVKKLHQQNAAGPVNTHEVVNTKTGESVGGYESEGAAKRAAKEMNKGKHTGHFKVASAVSEGYTDGKSNMRSNRDFRAKLRAHGPSSNSAPKFPVASRERGERLDPKAQYIVVDASGHTIEAFDDEVDAENFADRYNQHASAKCRVRPVYEDAAVSASAIANAPTRFGVTPMKRKKSRRRIVKEVVGMRAAKAFINDLETWLTGPDDLHGDFYQTMRGDDDDFTLIINWLEENVGGEFFSTENADGEESEMMHTAVDTAAYTYAISAQYDDHRGIIAIEIDTTAKNAVHESYPGDEIDDVDDEDEDDENGFYVVCGASDDLWIMNIALDPDTHKWHESLVKDIVGSSRYHRIGGAGYMSYLSQNEIIGWLNRDYSDVFGPFESVEEAEQSQEVEDHMEDMRIERQDRARERGEDEDDLDESVTMTEARRRRRSKIHVNKHPGISWKSGPSKLKIAGAGRKIVNRDIEGTGLKANYNRKVGSIKRPGLGLHETVSIADRAKARLAGIDFTGDSIVEDTGGFQAANPDLNLKTGQTETLVYIDRATNRDGYVLVNVRTHQLVDRKFATQQAAGYFAAQKGLKLISYEDAQAMQNKEFGIHESISIDSIVNKGPFEDCDIENGVATGRVQSGYTLNGAVAAVATALGCRAAISNGTPFIESGDKRFHFEADGDSVVIHETVRRK